MDIKLISTSDHTHDKKFIPSDFVIDVDEQGNFIKIFPRV